MDVGSCLMSLMVLLKRSCQSDFVLILWNVTADSDMKPKACMTGFQLPSNPQISETF